MFLSSILCLISSLICLVSPDTAFTAQTSSIHYMPIVETLRTPTCPAPSPGARSSLRSSASRRTTGRTSCPPVSCLMESKKYRSVVPAPSPLTVSFKLPVSEISEIDDHKSVKEKYSSSILYPSSASSRSSQSV